MTLRPYPFDRSFRGSYSRYRDIFIFGHGFHVVYHKKCMYTFVVELVKQISIFYSYRCEAVKCSNYTNKFGAPSLLSSSRSSESQPCLAVHRRCRGHRGLHIRQCNA
jgi:hypothetical protein